MNAYIHMNARTLHDRSEKENGRCTFQNGQRSSLSMSHGLGRLTSLGLPSIDLSRVPQDSLRTCTHAMVCLHNLSVLVELPYRHQATFMLTRLYIGGLS